MEFWTWALLLVLAMAGVAVESALADAAPPLFLSMDSGERHSCAVLTDGKVVCWGADDRGQLGDGFSTSEDRSIPVQVEGIANAVDIAVGGDFACALLSDQSLRCWGAGTLGQLGNGSTIDRDSPVTVQAVTNAVDVAAGRYHACAVLESSTVVCWGYNASGRLGDGTSTNSSVPVSVSSITTATAVGAGEAHSCARLLDGTGACWGRNSRGQLGAGSTASFSLVPLAVNALADASDVALGGEYSCALRASGAVICWGDNYYGQIGDGATLYRTFTRRTQPVFNVIGISTANAISAGTEYACATLVGGEMRCWGRNDYGNLGDGGYADTSTPVSVTNLSTAVQPAAGKDHTCAVRSDGRGACWGFNFYGQLGDDSEITGNLATSFDSAVPVVVTGPHVIGLATGNAANCALRRDGSAWCWGDAFERTPIDFGDGATYADVGAGQNHACAVVDDGTVRCRGGNEVGQLGDGSTTSSFFAPVDVVGITTAESVGSENRHGCAVLEGGSLECWGLNDHGQLGDGSMIDSSFPVVVGGLPAVARVGPGFRHTCAVTQVGGVYCWGSNLAGELGGATGDPISTVPVAIPGLSNAVDVTSGTSHSCALLGNGDVRCWGGNLYGQMGNGTTGTSSPPVAPTGLPSVVQLSVDGLHSCALLDGRSIRCWGRNSNGQLGDGTTMDSSLPVAVSGIDDAWIVAAGRSHTCAGVDKTLPWGVSVFCWGRAVSGSLGNDWQLGDPGNELLPIPVIQSFTPIRFRLAVEVQGDGTGTVTSLHPGIDCGGDCEEVLSIGSIVRLTVTPDPPAVFNGWGGDGDCTDGVVTLEADRHCVAFVPEPGMSLMLVVGVAALFGRAAGGRKGTVEKVDPRSLQKVSRTKKCTILGT